MPQITPIVADQGVQVDATTVGVPDDVGVTTTALASGVDYLVLAGSVARNLGDAGSFAAVVRQLLGATTIGTHEAVSPFSSGGPAAGTVYGGTSTGMVAIVTGNGSDTLSMDVAPSAAPGGGTASVAGSHYRALPLDGLTPDADYFEAEVASPSATTIATWSTAVALTFTAPEDGTYPIIGWCEVDGPGTADEAWKRLQITAGAGAPATIRGGTLEARDIQTIARNGTRLIGTVTLTAGDSVTVEYQVQGPGQSLALANARLVALRPGAFPGLAYAETLTGLAQPTGTGSLPTTVALAAPGSGTRRYIVLYDSTHQATNWSSALGTMTGTGGTLNAAPVAGNGVTTTGLTVAGDMVLITGMIDITVAAGDSVSAGVNVTREAGVGNSNFGVGRGETPGAGTVYGNAMLAIPMEVAPLYPLVGEASADTQWSFASGALEALFSDGAEVDAQWTFASSMGFACEGEATADVGWAFSSSPVYALEGEASADVSWTFSSTVSGNEQLEGEASVDVSWSFASVAFPSIEDVLGSMGQELELRVVGVDGNGEVVSGTGDHRPLRFELLDVAGSGVDATIIESIEVQLRRASDPPSSTVALTPTNDPETVDGLTYTWSVDLSATVTVPVLWVLEIDVVFADGSQATWPSAGPQRIRAVSVVSI